MEEDSMANISGHITGKNEEEVRRLSGRPPLITLLTFIIGPLCSNVTQTLYGVINGIWISRYVGEDGLAAIASEVTFEGVCRSFGQFLAVTGSTQISSLFGQKKFQEAEQVLCDTLRVAVICGCIVPAIILPSNYPLLNWFGTPENVMELGRQYILPMSACNVLTCSFLGCTGFLQAEGRTTLVGIIDICAMGFGMCCVCPLTLIVFKLGMYGPSIATVIADGVPAILLIICYFTGRFGIKPKLSGFLKKFSPYTWKGLAVGSSQLVAQLSLYIPGITLRYFLGRSCSSDDELRDALAGYNTMVRFFNITTCVVFGVNAGYLPAASYAYASNMYKRYLRLSIHMNWISLGWCVVVGLLGYCIPREISKLFGSTEEFLYWSTGMMKSGNCLNIICFVRSSMQTQLQAQQRGARAMVLSFGSQLFSNIIFQVILYYTDRKNPTRLMYSAPLSIAFGMLLGIALLFGPFRELVLKARASKVQDVKDSGEVIGGEEEDISLQKV